MRTRLVDALTGPRGWLLLGMLMSRAAGFLTGLVLARTAGAPALGLYTTVMNTAAPLVAPISHAMINTGTLMAVESQGRNLRALWRAQLMLCAAATALVLPLFAWLFQRAIGSGELPEGMPAWALVGAAAVVLGQLATPVIAALLHGEGRYREAGRCAVIAGTASLVSVVPAVAFFGPEGPLAAAAANALLALCLLSVDIVKRHHVTRADPRPSIWPGLTTRLRSALPAVAGLGLNGATAWVCTVYLVNVHWGSAGMGVLSVGLQWSTLLLMPATSWGGMTLGILGSAQQSGDRSVLMAALRAQLARNAAVTAIAAVVVVAAGGLLERLYRMPDSGLLPTLAAFSAAAVVTSLNNVFERLWWAAGRQRSWFVWQTLSLLVQIAATLWLLPQHVAYAGVAVLAAALTLAACSVVALRSSTAQITQVRP